MHNLWRYIGSPRHGVINAARLKSKFEYKQAIKRTAATYEQDNADGLNAHFISKDTTSFWKCWNSKFKKSLSTPISVAGKSDSTCIANEFRSHFSNTFIKSSDDLHSVNEFISHRESHKADVQSLPPIDVEIIERCIKSLKCNKSAGFDEIVAEHLIHCHESIVVHLKFLFSMMLKHAYVPKAFSYGIVIPIVKDKAGDLSSVDNYRPITLSPLLSKVFELFLLESYSKHLHSDNLQFGFKKHLGCSNAIFVLRQVVEHFNKRGSSVYIASLDASKGFDRINHYKMFSLLYKSSLPTVFINIIVEWYSKLTSVVRWNHNDSLTFEVTSGVRQGGILSPILFNFYVNSLITSLKDLDLGCHFHSVYIGCIMYADDLLLLSASMIDLQTMLDKCALVGSQLGIAFNSTKSKSIIIGPNVLSKSVNLNINGAPLQWVDKLKYLGIYLCSGSSFIVDLTETRRKFFACLNSIISKCRYSSELVNLKLVESHCLPILSYAMESLNVNISQLKEINSWWNAVYRKLFNYNKWESVKEVILIDSMRDFILYI